LVVQGAAIALAQKLMTIVDKQSKPSYSSKLSSVGDACGTSSSGLASEKSSSCEYLCSIFSYGRLSCGASVLFFIKSYFCFKIW
jgi:protein farnesyltransferase subunit beta